MAQNENSEELQELKSQFELLNQKLDQQRIIDEHIIRESMRKRLSYSEKLHWFEIVMPPILVLLLLPFFIAFHYPWIFILLFSLFMIAVSVFNGYCYKGLKLRDLPDFDVTSATECVIRYKKRRILFWKIMTLPLLLIFGWWIYLIGAYNGFNFTQLSFIIVCAIIGTVVGVSLELKNFRHQNDVLKHIMELRK